MEAKHTLCFKKVLFKMKGKKKYFLIRLNSIFCKILRFKDLGTLEFNEMTQNKNQATAHMTRGSM